MWSKSTHSGRGSPWGTASPGVKHVTAEELLQQGSETLNL